ncbi:MAG: hypothetical protein K2I72_00015, partial [Bacilli bacterium]|nr:hypothetical protein [Bacilli bacterium]
MKKYLIKSKLVDGEKKYGIVDDHFNEVVPFQYDQIIGNNGVFILKRNGKPDEVFSNGKLIITEKENYYEIEYVIGDSYFKVGRMLEDSSLEYGIIHASLFGGISIAYPFGKATKMVVDGKRVLLYNEKKTKTRKGVWGDLEVGTLDPIYDSFYT